MQLLRDGEAFSRIRAHDFGPVSPDAVGMFRVPLNAGAGNPEMVPTMLAGWVKALGVPGWAYGYFELELHQTRYPYAAGGMFHISAHETWPTGVAHFPLVSLKGIGAGQWSVLLGGTLL